MKSPMLNFSVLGVHFFHSSKLKFQVFKNFNTKIGMNTTANKLFHVNNLIGLDMLNLKFVHFKKLAKIHFLKYGKT